MDGGAWWATFHGVAKSLTWLSNFTFFLPFKWTRLRTDFNGLESTRETRNANTSQNLSPALENFMDLKDGMACACAAPVATSSLWACLVIANNSLFTGQIVSSMANVKQKMLNRKNLRQKAIANTYYKNSIKNIGNFYHSGFPGGASGKEPSYQCRLM